MEKFYSDAVTGGSFFLFFPVICVPYVTNASVLTLVREFSVQIETRGPPGPGNCSVWNRCIIDNRNAAIDLLKRRGEIVIMRVIGSSVRHISCDLRSARKFVEFYAPKEVARDVCPQISYVRREVPLTIVLESDSRCAEIESHGFESAPSGDGVIRPEEESDEVKSSMSEIDTCDLNLVALENKSVMIVKAKSSQSGFVMSQRKVDSNDVRFGFSSVASEIYSGDRPDVLSRLCFEKLIGSGYDDGRFAMPKTIYDKFLLELLQFGNNGLIVRFHDLLERKTLTYFVRTSDRTCVGEIINYVMSQNVRSDKMVVIQDFVFTSFDRLPPDARDFRLVDSDWDRSEYTEWEGFHDERVNKYNSRKGIEESAKAEDDRNDSMIMAYFSQSYTSFEYFLFAFEIDSGVYCLYSVDLKEYEGTCVEIWDQVDYKKEMKFALWFVASMIGNLRHYPARNVDSFVKQYYFEQCPYWYRYNVGYTELVDFGLDGYPLGIRRPYKWIQHGIPDDLYSKSMFPVGRMVPLDESSLVETKFVRLQSY